MSIGLLIKDANGNTIMDPSTFTVRMVDAKVVYLGEMAPGATFRVDMSPEVRAGMFAAVVPLYQYERNVNINGSYDWFMANSEWTENTELPQLVLKRGAWAPHYLMPSTPWADVYDGHVMLRASSVPTTALDRAPVRAGHTRGDVAIYVMTYI